MYPYEEAITEEYSQTTKEKMDAVRKLDIKSQYSPEEAKIIINGMDELGFYDFKNDYNQDKCYGCIDKNMSLEEWASSYHSDTLQNEVKRARKHEKSLAM